MNWPTNWSFHPYELKLISNCKNQKIKSLNETESFHRPKTAPSFEYFTEEMIDLGNEYVKEIHEQLLQDGLPTFDFDSYRKMKLFVMEKNF